MKIDHKDFSSRLGQFFTRLAPFGFSGAVLVVHDDDVLLRKGYGLADRENGVANTPETVFCLGSVTKQFTAAAVMKLAQMGKLDPRDRIAQYLGGVPADKSAITLHHLLTHSAGVLNYTGPDYEPADQEHLLQKVLDTPLEFEPGADYDYSNAGYSVLAAIVEMVAQQPFEHFLYENLLNPTGMQSTGYTRPDWSGSPIARWYTGADDHGHALEKHYPSWNIMGNGEMLSTLDDMLRWHTALLGDDLLVPESKVQMFTPHQRDYGYGWRVTESEIGKLIEHNGASDLGASALFRRYVDAGLTIMLFCNQSYGDSPMVLPMQDKIDQLIAGEEIGMPPQIDPVPVPELMPFVGGFDLPGGRITCELRGDTLALATEGQPAINLLAFPGLPADAHAALNETHQRIFEKVARGDLSPLAEILAEKERRFEPVGRMLQGSLAYAREEYGELQSIEVLGTVPSSFFDGALDTVISVKFAGGTTGMISITRDGMNVGVSVLELTQAWAMPCVPLGADQLVGYHLPLGRVVTLGVNRNSAGKVVGVEPIQ